MKGKNAVKGIILLLLAASIILDALGVIAVGVLRLALSVLMLYIFIKSIPSLNFYGILIPVSVVMILFDKALGIEKITPFPVLLCAILASVGLSFIFGYAPFSKKTKSIKNHGRVHENDGDSHIVISGMMLSLAKYLSSENLERVTVDVKASNVELYFDKAKIKGDEAEVCIDIRCSNLCLYVPSDILVVDSIHDKSMSNVEFPNSPQLSENVKKLVLSGSAKMSNLEVVYI